MMGNIWKSASLMLLISASSVVTAFCQEMHDEKIKGNVKQVTIYMYEAEDVKIDPRHLNWKAVQQYNVNSKITEHSHYDKKGRLEFKDSYVYNDLGLLSQVNNEEDGIVVQTDVFNYDAKGNQIENISRDEEGKLAYWFTYKINERGQKVEENIFGQNDKLKFRNVLSYDANGNNVETSMYDSTATLLRIWRSKYDSKKNLIENNNIGPDNAIVTSSTYKYTYYPTGAIKTETNYEDGNISSKDTFDEKGNVVESIIYSGLDDKDFISKELFKYSKFDSNGNWLQLTRHEAGANRIIMVRDIQYY